MFTSECICKLWELTYFTQISQRKYYLLLQIVLSKVRQTSSMLISIALTRRSSFLLAILLFMWPWPWKHKNLVSLHKVWQVKKNLYLKYSVKVPPNSTSKPHSISAPIICPHSFLRKLQSSFKSVTYFSLLLWNRRTPGEFSCKFITFEFVPKIRSCHFLPPLQKYGECVFLKVLPATLAAQGIRDSRVRERTDPWIIEEIWDKLCSLQSWENPSSDAWS